MHRQQHHYDLYIFSIFECKFSIYEVFKHMRTSPTQYDYKLPHKIGNLDVLYIFEISVEKCIN